MRFSGHRFRLCGFEGKLLRVVLVAVVLAVSVLQGLSVCFCDSYVQSCGDEQCQTHHKHDCHGTTGNAEGHSLEHDCAHLEIESLNAIITSGKVDPEVSSLVGLVFISLMSVKADLSSADCNSNYLKNKNKGLPKGLPPQLIYNSRSVKVLC
ncbi:MAG: hypothetical protein R6V06_04540 [Kiritimatiellia bacterium]